MSAITVEGDLVHYEKLGRGRPVILLHGWIGSWRYWIPTMQHLQSKFSLYALDLFGFGDSSKNNQKYSLDKQVELLSAFVKEMGIPKTAIIAHGLGALVAAEYARRAPDKVARLLMVSAPLFDVGGLAERNPPGHRRELTPPPLTQTVPIVGTASAVETPAVTTAPSTAATSASDAAQTGSKPPVASTPSEGKPAETPEHSNSAHSAPTIASAGAIDRATLARVYAAETAADVKLPTEIQPDPNATPAFRPAGLNSSAPQKPKTVRNPLQELFNIDMESLLGRCFKRSEAPYEKLRIDLAKTDAAALKISVSNFDPLEMLERLHGLEMPLVFVHGVDDPIVENPGENVWNYLAMTKSEEKLLPIPLRGVRHFPMLENDRFNQLVIDFLEKPDISTIEVQERWKRRSR
jgi:pimeloyl-ACP methyl ester carboxylesterase